MLYLIGLGLGDAKDITVKGLEIIRQCDRVYLESYTSILSVSQEELETFYGRSLILADRELVEDNGNTILPKTPDENVALLVVGDPFGATTHTDLALRARERNIKVKVIHNASIMTAVGCCGLQLYTFGEAISIPYWTDRCRPDSFYERIVGNRRKGLHTLCLLDIKVKEPTLETICKKKKEYYPPRFMSVAEAAKQLLEIIANNETERKVGEENDEFELHRNTLAVGLARIGSDDQRIAVGTLEELSNTDLGPPLHCMIIPAVEMHPLEEEFLRPFTIQNHSAPASEATEIVNK